MDEINYWKQKYKELKHVIESLKELDLYTVELDYDYEENPTEITIPFDLELFIDCLQNDIDKTEEFQKTIKM